MAVTALTFRLVPTSGQWSIVGLRNSTTTPVDATSGAPNRLTLPFSESPGNGAPPVQKTITGATNATPIVLTVDSITNITDGDWVRVNGVGGNTNANGTFLVTSVSGSNITLVGSAGNAAYTSGGTLTKLRLAKNLHEALAVVVSAAVNDYAANA